jgi:hypothetical protein
MKAHEELRLIQGRLPDFDQTIQGISKLKEALGVARGALDQSLKFSRENGYNPYWITEALKKIEGILKNNV